MYSMYGSMCANCQFCQFCVDKKRIYPCKAQHNGRLHGVDSAGWLCSAACPRENNVSTMVRTNQLSLLTRRRVFEGITPVPVTPDNCAPGHRAVPRGILQPRVRARRVPSGPAAAARFITIHTVYTDYLILLRSVEEW